MSYNGSGKADPLSFSLNVAYLLEKSERKFVIIVDFFGFRVLIECFTVSLANSDPLEVTEHHLVPDLYVYAKSVTWKTPLFQHSTEVKSLLIRVDTG